MSFKIEVRQRIVNIIFRRRRTCCLIMIVSVHQTTQSVHVCKSLIGCWPYLWLIKKRCRTSKLPSIPMQCVTIHLSVFVNSWNLSLLPGNWSLVDNITAAIKTIRTIRTFLYCLRNSGKEECSWGSCKVCYLTAGGRTDLLD